MKSPVTWFGLGLGRLGIVAGQKARASPGRQAQAQVEAEAGAMDEGQRGGATEPGS
jgi:hypothetical protein